MMIRVPETIDEPGVYKANITMTRECATMAEKQALADSIALELRDHLLQFLEHPAHEFRVRVLVADSLKEPHERQTHVRGEGGRGRR